MDINKLNRHFITIDNLNNIDTVIDVLTEPWVIKYEDTYYSTESNNNMKFTLFHEYSPEYIKNYYDRNRSTILALCTPKTEDDKYYTFVYKNLLTDLNNYNDSEGNSFIEYVKDIIIPNSVTSISLGMFSGKGNLESITLSNSLTSIHSFDYCSNLTHIDIPNSATTIEQNAFFACEKLETVKIGNSLNEINNDAFNSCESLKSIVIPPSVNYIKDNVFFNCTHMSSVTLNNGVKTIGENAFGNCVSLTSIKLPESLTYIATNAFTNCKQLTIVSTEYGDFKTDLYGDIFIMYNNSNSMVFNVRDAINNEIWYTTTDDEKLILTDESNLNVTHEYTRGKGVINFVDQIQLTNINEELFMGQKNLSTIQIPLTVTRIYESAFAECISLNSVKLTNNDIENTHIEIIDKYAFKNCHSLTYIILPQSITGIEEGAFENCEMLNNIILPNNLTIITKNSFSACKSLTFITIPLNVNTIEDNAFQECFNIKHIEFTPGITSIGEYAFSKCNLLTSVNLYDINIIGNKAFSDCVSLTSVTFDKINANHNINKNIFDGCEQLDHIIVDNEIFYREGDEITVFDSNKQPFTFILKEILQSNDEIWYTTANGEKAKFGSPYTNISTIDDVEYDFQSGIPGDSGLENWYTPTGDTYTVISHEYNSKVGYFIIKFDKPIKEYILQTYDPIGREGGGWLSENRPNKVLLPNELESIHRDAFYSCNDMDFITIPSTVTYIGMHVFFDSNITTIEYHGTKEQWNAIAKDTELFSGDIIITVKCSDGDIIIENHE